MNTVFEGLVKHFLANCDVLRDLVSFVQFKKREKHPWRLITCTKITFTKSNIPPWVFFTVFKLYKWYQMAQRITIISCFLTSINIKGYLNETQ